MYRLRGTIWIGPLLALLSVASPVWPQSPPTTLPRYDLGIVMDVPNHLVHVREIVTWTNTSKLPVKEIIFKAHAHYSIPGKDIGFLAKVAEIIRMSPKESMSFDGPALQIDEVRFRSQAKETGDQEPLAHFFAPDNATALTVPL